MDYQKYSEHVPNREQPKRGFRLPTKSDAKKDSATVSRTLLGGFMVLFLVVGFVLALLSPDTLQAPTNADLLNGDWSAQYQQTFEENLLLRDTAETVWGGLTYGLFAEGRSGVVVGHNEWLFSREEFVAFEQQTLNANVDYIGAVRDYLAARDINLVVALVPAKAKIYAEQLKQPLPTAQAERYETVLAQLRERDISTPDLSLGLTPASPSYDDATFFRTDTHWTPLGAQFVAQELADEVASTKTLNALGETEFVTEPLATEPLRGDLYNFLVLGGLETAIGPQYDVLEATQTSKASSSADLFGSPDIPVALVGTSYSADERWNFAGALKKQLTADVLNVAEAGAGPFAPMAAYLSSAAFENAKPELVIWELPERQVTYSYDLEPLPSPDLAQQ